MENKKKFRKIVNNIKAIKIQGARNIARAALYAYTLEKNPKSRQELINARPTEPMLVNTLKNFDKLGYKETLAHFDYSQDKINENVLSMVKNNSIIFTHCHSSNVVKALIYTKKKAKKFTVYNTETRPLFQGRITAKELSKAGIKVTMFLDSAFDIALGNKKNHVNYVFLGSDAILKKGAINKIGSGAIAKLAYLKKIPVYIIADSWKFSNSCVKIEERDFHEAWQSVPKKIKIKNPAFEFIPKKYIKAVVSELGILSYDNFLKKVRK